MSEINIPGPSMGLNQVIDAFTHQIIEDDSKQTKYNPLRPSSAGKCTRELGHEYMQYKGYAKYVTESKQPSVHRLLNLGSNIEYHANEEMRRAFARSEKPIKMKYKQQTVDICRLNDGTLIEGNIDLWIETADWRCLADWKSKSDKYSQFYKSSWDEFVEKLVATGFAVSFGEDAVYITDLEKFLEVNRDTFFNKNLYQINLYGCTEFARSRNITFCSVMQYNKNDSRIREVRFTPTESVAAKTRTKFIQVADVVDTDKSVDRLPKDYILGSQACAFCPFRGGCWPEDDALKLYFKTLPPKAWAKDLNRLPDAVQGELRPLFEQYERLSQEQKNISTLEEKIIKILDENKVYKVKISKSQVYKVKRLKEGYVLRRDKE